MKMVTLHGCVQLPEGKLKGMRSDYTGYQLSNVGCNHPRLVEHQWYMLMIPSTSIHHIKQPKKHTPDIQWI
jgi:hypothetical protein